MKKKFYVPLLLIFYLGLLLSSCQKEATEYVDETNNGETILANSVLARMLISASQNNGSIDDIIDGSSCISVVLPVTVYANNQQLSIQEIDDFQLIEEIFGQYPNDIDTLEIVFPIYVVYEDFSQTEIANQTTLDSLIANCPNLIEDTYSCVDFIYPISCFIYNTTSEQIGQVTLNNNYEWFGYLTYLTEDILIAIDYQMAIVINNQTLQINNNQELTDAFAQVDCEIASGGGVDPDVEALRTIMKDGTWYVSQFLDDGIDETSDFSGYDFTFIEAIRVYARNGTSNIYGTWIVTLSADELNFEFDMDSPLNGADDDEYKVIDYNDTLITFVTRDSNGNIEDTLIFRKN